MTKITENDIELWVGNIRSLSLKQGVWTRKQGSLKALNPFVFSGFSQLSKFYSQLSKVHNE